MPVERGLRGGWRETFHSVERVRFFESFPKAITSVLVAGERVTTGKRVQRTRDKVGWTNGETRIAAG